MGAAIAAFDWSTTPLGPIAAWPAVLKIAVSTMINSAFPKCLCWGPDLIMIYNDGFVPILDQKHPCLGRPFLDVWAETADRIRPISDQAMAGEAVFIEDFPILTNRSGSFETAWFTFCYSPVRDENGRVVGMLDTVIETTGKVQSQRLARLRSRELVHRSRNAYALVSALVNQTLRGASSADAARDELQRRIGALVRAQDLLMEETGWSSALDLIVERALKPFMGEDGRIQIAGPGVAIGRAQVTTLSLALHELATNAMKYGALSVPEGEVLLSWEIVDSGEAPVFRLTWQERGGPQVVASERRGFGSRLIGRILPESFGGEVSIDYAPEGLQVVLTADAANLAGDEPQIDMSDPQMPAPPPPDGV